MRRWALAFVLAAACGGSQKAADEPVVDDDEEEVADDEEEDTGDDVMVEPEKLEDLQRTMERRSPRVSRCYADALEAGELKPSDRGEVTVGLTVTESGKATNVRVLQSSIKSKMVEDCVLEEVRSARFTTLPKPVEFSYTYKLERDY